MKIKPPYNALLPFLLAPLFLAGCGTKEGPDCGKVSGHFIDLVRAELAKDGDAERLKTARANLPTLQNAILVRCEESSWDRGSRQCILDAKTAAETRECEPSMPSPEPAAAPVED